MREGWTYKKLGEVCRINSGKSIKACEILDDQQEGFVPCYGGNGIRGYVKSVSHTGTYPIVGRVGALCGNVHLATGSFYATEHALVFTCENQNVDKRWLARYLESQSLGKYAKGVAQPVIAAGELSKLCIHIPPLYVQDTIVSELDEINSLLALKREQLQKYDKLAQSLFYEMFGDPVENEKGWVVKNLEDLCENKDSLRKPITASDRISGNIPYYGASGIVDYVRDYIFDDEYLLISEDGANLIARSTPIAFSIKGKSWVNNHAHILKFSNFSTQLFVEYNINLRDISPFITGAVQPKLNQAKMNIIPIPLPPLPLQQQFASRIEQIESQKQQVQAAIEKLETLLASRMQYWFD